MFPGWSWPKTQPTRFLSPSVIMARLQLTIAGGYPKCTSRPRCVRFVHLINRKVMGHLIRVCDVCIVYQSVPSASLFPSHSLVFPRFIWQSSHVQTNNANRKKNDFLPPSKYFFCLKRTQTYGEIKSNV